MQHRRTWGMRFDPMDGVAIGTAAAATVGAWSVLGSAALVIPTALGHFFLFCNVFRIRRRLELVWATAFVVNCATWLAFAGQTPWLGILAGQTPLTAGLIAREIRSPRYHGILANRWNPRLGEYLDGKH